MTSFFRARHRTRRLFWRWRAVRQHNPLLRRTTPAQRVAIAALLLAVLGTIIGGALAVAAMRTSALDEAQQQATSSHRTTATVLAPDDPAAAALNSDGTPLTQTNLLRWSWQGRTHTGDWPTLANLDPGTTTTVWVDNTGQLVPSPWTGADITLVVAGLALSTALFAGVVALGAMYVFHVWNLRHRAKSWAAEWATVAPLWSRQNGFR